MINIWAEIIIKILLFFFCIIIKRFLVKYMKGQDKQTFLVEMWMNGDIIVSFILILISVYRLCFL